jgi:hypothetical protein
VLRARRDDRTTSRVLDGDEVRLCQIPPDPRQSGGSDRIFTHLTEQEAEGLACVVCDADYLTDPTPHVPVGRSRTGSQVFACQAGCAASG